MGIIMYKMNHLFTLGCYISSICTESSSPSPTISKSSNSESDDRSEGSDRSVRDPHESFGVRSYGVNSLNFLAGEISFEILDCDDEDKFVVLLSSEDKVVSPKSGRLFFAAAARSRCRLFLNQFPTCVGVKLVFSASSRFFAGFGYGS